MVTGPPRRTPNLVELTARSRRILYAAVSEYIASGEPVSSGSITRRYGLNLSPATIRSELSDLERAGYLAQPHTSAGRIPTEPGFRVFVDALVEMREVSATDRSAIIARMRSLRPGVDDVLREAGRLLATITGTAAVITRPRSASDKLSQLRFMPLGENTLLAVIITRSGGVQNRVVDLLIPITPSELERINNYLGDRTHDRSLIELRDLLETEVYRAKQLGTLSILEEQSAQVVSETTRVDPHENVVIEGQNALLHRTEFQSDHALKDLLKTLDEREQLLTLLERTITAGGVRVLVGTETELEDLKDVSVISSDYRTGGVKAGALGVIGPARMDYGKLMPLVGFTAQVVSDVLAGRLDDENKG